MVQQSFTIKTGKKKWEGSGQQGRENKTPNSFLPQSRSQCPLQGLSGLSIALEDFLNNSQEVLSPEWDTAFLNAGHPSSSHPNPRSEGNLAREQLSNFPTC